jgi:hypothetical protein
VDVSLCLRSQSLPEASDVILLSDTDCEACLLEMDSTRQELFRLRCSHEFHLHCVHLCIRTYRPHTSSTLPTCSSVTVVDGVMFISSSTEYRATANKCPRCRAPFTNREMRRVRARVEVHGYPTRVMSYEGSLSSPMLLAAMNEGAAPRRRRRRSARARGEKLKCPEVAYYQRARRLRPVDGRHGLPRHRYHSRFRRLPRQCPSC